jgi:mono/diheme cytochrome c family protein
VAPAVDSTGRVGASGTGGPWIRSAWRLPGAAALVVVGTLSAHAQAKQSAQPPDPAAVQRGAYLLTAANCASCHTLPGSGSAHQLAGGRALPTPFGVFFSPNITPDPIHGIGGWTFGDFKRALRRGVSPSNTHYYPVFPYTSYTGMSDSDIEDLWAYLGSVPPVSQPNRPHELGFPYSLRLAMAPWKVLFLDQGPLKPEPGRPPEWNRGRYLVNAVAHCADCHAPRNFLGAVDRGRTMSGTRERLEGYEVPNITPDIQTGIGRWSVGDVTGLLAGRGMRAMHVGGPMREVVRNTSRLSEADRTAMAVYLKSLPPRFGEVKPGGMMGGMCH